MSINPNPDRADELELRELLYNAMDGNLRMSRRRELLAAYREAVLAASSAVSVVPPATNQTALRKQIAEAPCVCGEPETPDSRHRTDGPCHVVDTRMRVAALAIARTEARKWADGEPLKGKPLWQTYLGYADAVLAVLPAPVDRAAVLREAADRLAELRAAEREWLPATGLHKGEQELRRMADEQPAVGSCVAAEAPHAVTPDEALPREPHPTEADLHHALAVLGRFQGRDDAEPAAPETVHACPPDGSGLTPCCGRTPFELPRTDRISSEPAAVTCAPAAVAQPGKDPS